MAQTYLAKHAFAGQAAQSQLTFPKGAVLTAKPGQEGSAWWWGSYNGREGWFPPAYVTPQAQPDLFAATLPSVNTQQQSMQQRMQQTSFRSSIQHQQQRPQSQGLPNQAFGMQPGGFVPNQQQQSFMPTQTQGMQNFGVPPLAQSLSASFSAPAPAPSVSGFRLGADDPFAGLDSTPIPIPASQFSSSLPLPAVQTMAAGPQPVTPKSNAPMVQSIFPPVQAQPKSIPSSANSDASAAMARLGIAAPQTARPAPKPFAASPTPPLSQGLASPAPPVAQRYASPTPPPQTASQPARKNSPTYPIPTSGATSAVPVVNTKEDLEARRVREQEEARLKEQMRKEKEELAKQAAAATYTGIGASGVTLPAVGDDLGALSSVHMKSASFNPYDFLSGTDGVFPKRTFSPIYRVPPFWALMQLESYVRRFPISKEKLADVAGMYAQLSKALSFICHVVVETDGLARSGRGRFGLGKRDNTGAVDGPLSFLRMNHWACEACVKLISILPHSAGASGKQLDGLFLNFLNVFVSVIENLQANQQLVLPGGWQQTDYTHLCLYVVRNCGDGKFSFTVINTGTDGLEYHPSSFDSETGRQLKQLAMTIWNIPAQRLMDSTFWTLLFRMQVYPSKKNNAHFLYTKLLPALNSQPLLSNLDQGPHEFLEPPDEISALSFHPLARLALATTPAAGARPAKYSTLLVMNAAIDLAYATIENSPPSSMDPEDSRILKLAGRNLANYASTLDPLSVADGTLGASLSSTWDLLDKTLKKLSYSGAKPVDIYSHGLSATAQNDAFAKGTITSLRTDAGSVAHPLFGRLRTDNYAEVVRHLMGSPRPDPILIPAVLTDETLPPVATNFQEAASSLQRIADACSLLLQQRQQVKNAAAFAASATQYAMTHVLPMPHLDSTHCFWRKGEMRRETQVNLMFLIRRVCRIYSAATACVQQSRGLVAIRSTTFACAACIADAICRVKAVDDPSQFALHYSGLCEGPTDWYGIEAGAFDTLGANLPIYDPNMCSLRFQCLDYLRGLMLKPDGSYRNTIFNFDLSQSPMEGDIALINQLSIQLALPRPDASNHVQQFNHAAALIAGRNGAIIEVLPEFEYFRDIVFHFKHSVSGKAQTPPVDPKKKKPPTPWTPSDAMLRWDLQRKDKEEPAFTYSVSAYRGTQQEFVDRVAITAPKESASGFQGFLSLFNKTTEERARLSSADPANVVNSCGEKFRNSRAKPISVDNEDDVLHLTKEELPSFGHVLTPSDSERFVQFLTVPYIRIPLILDFFANGDPGRLTALKTKSLQLIVDAALFEPGNWKPSDFTEIITEVPVVDRDKLHMLLSTPHGTLFNEIAKSPDVLTSCIIKMLERALDMDVGKYTKVSSSGPLILYTIRLAVRIEGFLKYALSKCRLGQQRPRGLESMDNSKVESAIKKIRNMLDSQAIPTLEYWIDPSRNKDVDVSCLVHSHLLYLFKNYSYEDLDYRAVSVLLSSQVYLTINHRFSNNVYDDLQDTPNPTHPPPSIQIAQSEIFDIIQSKRYHILRFIRERQKEGDHAMEAVVRIATGTGTRELGDAELKERHWESIGHHTCYGRFIPDTEDIKLRNGTYRIPKPGQKFEDWMMYVTTKAVGIEVNLQLSDFTLQNHKMSLLDQNIMEDQDFQVTRKTALKDASDLACAEVTHTTNRFWWSLVGRRYDVQSWAPDPRNYVSIKEALNPAFTRKFPGGLRPGERWIEDVLKDKINLLLPNVVLQMSTKDFSEEPFALLAGWIENPKTAGTLCTHTLKEVVVWQYPPVINIFNVAEHGRRHFRVLEYTSNMSLCQHEGSGEPYPDRVGGILSMSTGIPMTTLEPESTLVITRALNAELGTQTLIQDRYLAGLLPTALIERYTFWQSEDDNIIGYETQHARGEHDEEVDGGADNDKRPTTRLKITLAKADEFDRSGFCNSSAEAMIQRIPVSNARPEVLEVDPNRPVMTLLNVLSAPPSSLLKRIGMLLSRLDNLAHVVFWCAGNVKSAHAAASVDVIELPRVNLKFVSRKVESVDGQVEQRLYSNDHDGLFISTSVEAREIAERLLGSISHFLVLQNAENDLFVLMPGCALPRRLHIDGSHLSVQVILDRRNQEWIDNIGEVRCYMYPIHNSRSFLVTPSLASSMYLMVMYFITGSYQEVYKMVESCVSEELTPEEKQIFDQLEYLGNDMHPDAHACRLKLSVVTVGLGGDDSMRCPWSVTEEMEEYCKKHPFVSSACRLSTEEELLLLQLCTPSARDRLSLALLNRKAYVTAVSSLGKLPPDKSLTVRLGTEKTPSFENFDAIVDNTIIDNPKKTMISSKLFGAAYARPEEVRPIHVVKWAISSSYVLILSLSDLGSSCIRGDQGARIHQRGPQLRYRSAVFEIWLSLTLRFDDKYGHVQTAPE